MEKEKIKILKMAMVFASYKIGENGGANGFLSENELEKWSIKTGVKE